MFDTISLLIQESLEGELKLMDNLSGSVCHHYALPAPEYYSSENQVNIPFLQSLHPNSISLRPLIESQSSLLCVMQSQGF